MTPMMLKEIHEKSQREFGVIKTQASYSRDYHAYIERALLEKIELNFKNLLTFNELEKWYKDIIKNRCDCERCGDTGRDCEDNICQDCHAADWGEA